MKRKTDYTRLIKTLKREKADAVPLIELGVHPDIKEKLLGYAPKNIGDEIEFMRRFGYDFVKIQPEITFNVGGKKVAANGGDSPLTSPDRTWAPEHQGIIADEKDIREYEWPDPLNIGYSKFEEAVKILPDDMCVIGQYGDIFTMAWELMGFENFAVAAYTDIELVGVLIDKIASIVVSMFENMSQIDRVEALWYSDDIAYASGLMLPPDFFRDILFPHIKRIGDLCLKKGIPFIYHSDGLLYEILDDLIECGVTAIHPIEPKSMNIKELQAGYGNKLCLCGGIDLDLLARGTEMEVSTLTKEFIETIGRNGSWGAGSSNSIPEYTNIENYLAMIRTVLSEGNL